MLFVNIWAISVCVSIISLKNFIRYLWSNLPNCFEADGSVDDFEVLDDPVEDEAAEVLLFWEPEAVVGVAVAE